LFSLNDDGTSSELLKAGAGGAAEHRDAAVDLRLASTWSPP
jgi:hypothetical protein